MRLRRYGTLIGVLATALVLGAWTDTSDAQSRIGGEAARPARAATTRHTRATRGDHVDRHFVNGMVPHHQGAIDMARAELDKGKDAKVKAMAQKMIDDQSGEIREMSDLSAKKWGSRPKTRHSGPMGRLMDMPISMDTSMAGEEVAGATDVDRMFLEMMVPHHAAAIVMAMEEQRNGADPKLKDMATKIIAAQAKEIGEIRQMLG